VTRRAILATAVLVGAFSATTACGSREPVEAAVTPPDRIMDFDRLYARNCAGCHGQDGKGGAAIALGDPLYLAIADDSTISRVTANGVAGTSMPAFAQHAGGTLTEAQINLIVSGIRSRWAKPGILGNSPGPPYASQSPGDAKRGAGVYETYCSSCHGPGGRGGRASSIVDGAYLTLVSDQSLRTVILVGRPELGAPDWRSDVPGKPMSPEDVSDAVAWLAAQRPQGGSR
jgi:cytochrome c oxidase cbb3-type subunit III